ncbi:MAG: TadE/TadG family type IV pilus assembly protein [Rhodospirillaceae bacterium]
MKGAARPGNRQRGATAVEFGIVAVLLLSLLIGAMEFGRVLFYWNTAAEATRLGARMAVVCDKDDSEIKVRMQEMLTLLTADKISIDYQPSGCTIDTCQRVTVSIAPGVMVATVMPFVPMTLALPSFSTTLPRESMSSEGGTNPVCS